MGWKNKIVNFFGSFTADGGNDAQAFIRNGGGSNSPTRNLSNEIFPQSFVSPKIDLGSWAASKEEAEQAAWPYRVAMQKMYERTRRNAHVRACMQRRMELTLLRDYELVGPDGTPDEQWTEYFKKAWFKQEVLVHILMAEYFGYSLISIGAIKDGVPAEITSIKRWNISPDRKHVSIFEKSPAGFSWEDAPYKKWHLWVPTLQDNGINNCGYGILYEVALLEILQRNNIQYNSDFIEMFAQPYRLLKTADTEGEEFNEKKAAMESMGHSGYLITGLNDELEFLNDGSRGNGYKAYNDFDNRVKADISKLIGGHADFIDSATKASGDKQSTGAGDITDDASGNTQVQKALAAKRMIDGDFVTNVVNEGLIPMLRELGVMLPDGLQIHFLNDTEERSIAAQEADKNQKIGTLALTFAQAGLKMSKEYAEGATGIEFSEIDIQPDNNVLTDKKEQAAGAGPLKDEKKKRTDKPKKTKKR